MKKRYGLIVAALAVFATACSSVDTAPDEMALHYEGGAVSDQKFKNCVNPGRHEFDGPSDKHYTYPVGQRTFRFDSNNNGADSGPIAIVTSDPVEMAVSGVMTFDFVRDCGQLREFHEKIGMKYRRDKGEENNAWWIAVLNDYLKMPLDKSMDAAAKGADFRSLYSSPDAKAAWEKAVIELLPVFVQQQAGAPYFTNFRLNLQTPEPPGDVKASFTRRQVAIEDNEAQKARNEQIRTALDGIRAEVDALGAEAWSRKYCVDRTTGQQGLPPGWNCFGGQSVVAK